MKLMPSHNQQNEFWTVTLTREEQVCSWGTVVYHRVSQAVTGTIFFNASYNQTLSRDL